MTEQKHAPEPWRIGARQHSKVLVYFCDREPEYGFGDDQLWIDCNTEANARRIVACVNACAGIPTKYLESSGLPDCADELQAMTAQRDQAREEATLWEQIAGKEAIANVDLVQQRDQLRAALEFYADKQRYMGSNQRIDSQDKYGESPSNTVYLWDVMKDNGDIARAALAAME